MPLILIVGFPSSGKTSWSKKLVKAFQDKISTLNPVDPGFNLKVILHNDESLGIKHDMYKESVTEKSARGAQMSAVKRDLSKNNLVILDGMNYIKGLRYQLNCEAKEYSTPYCVINIVTPSEVCFEWNSKRIIGEQWDESLLRALIMRFEEPNGQNRWDSPLISIGYDDEELPFDTIWEAIVLKKGPKPNHATIMKPAVGANFLQELDKQTMKVINDIVQYQNLNAIGGEVMIKNIGDDEQQYVVTLPTNNVSIAQLQRMRRTYLSLNRMRVVDATRIIPLFTEYLNHAFEVSN